MKSESNNVLVSSFAFANGEIDVNYIEREYFISFQKINLMFGSYFNEQMDFERQEDVLDEDPEAWSELDRKIEELEYPYLAELIEKDPALLLRYINKYHLVVFLEFVLNTYKMDDDISDYFIVRSVKKMSLGNDGFYVICFGETGT